MDAYRHYHGVGIVIWISMWTDTSARALQTMDGSGITPQAAIVVDEHETASELEYRDMIYLNFSNSPLSPTNSVTISTSTVDIHRLDFAIHNP